MVDNVILSAANNAPVAEYMMNEAMGDYIEDSSGHGRHGHIVGMTTGKPSDNPLHSCWVMGENTKAVELQGDGDYIELPSLGDVDWSKGLTFSCWYKPNDLTLSYREIASRLTGYGACYPRLYQMGNKLALQLYNNNSNSYEHITFNLHSLTNNWQHIAVTIDLANSECSIYINGQKETKTMNTTALLSGSGSAFLGGNSLWSNHSVHGVIDDVKIYNRVLSDSELNIL